MKDLDSGDCVEHYHCIAGEVKGKKECNSSDALAVYEHCGNEETNGEVWYDAYCYSCSQSFTMEQTHNSSVGGELGCEGGVVVDKKNFVKKPKAKPMEKDAVRNYIKKFGYVSNNHRGVRDEISQFFGHLTELNCAGKVVSQRYPETTAGSPWPTGYKIKYEPKAWNKTGVTGVNSQLSGQSKFNTGGKYLLIVGGELCKTSAFQMLKDDQERRKQGDYDPIAVVSPTTGEGSAAKQVALNYEFCDSFDIIVLCFDMDEAGQAANKATAAVLPKEKVRIAQISSNDPNDMLRSGKEKQFVRSFYGAKEFLPSELKHSAGALQEAKDFLNSEKIALPPFLHRLQKAMRGGIKTTGAIINLVGDTSIGKSLFTDALLYDWFWNSPLVPTIVSLERTTGELTVDFLSMHLKNNLSWFEEGADALAVLDDPANEDLIQDLLTNDAGESRYHVLDERSGSPDSLKACVERAVSQYGSKLIIFDPLTDFLRSLGTEAQEDFMMWQKQKKKEGIVFINVMHTRKPSSDKDGKVRKVTEYDVLGSGTFVQSADCNIVINRDKMAECPILRNTTCVDLPKIRGGTTGHACDIYYDYKERTLHDLDDHMAANPELAATRLPVEDETTNQRRGGKGSQQQEVIHPDHNF